MSDDGKPSRARAGPADRPGSPFPGCPDPPGRCLNPRSSHNPVLADGPAAEAGIAEGDIITAVDGTPVHLGDPLDLHLLRFESGDSVTLTVLRDCETLEIDVTLGTRPADVGH